MKLRKLTMAAVESKDTNKKARDRKDDVSSTNENVLGYDFMVPNMRDTPSPTRILKIGPP